MNQAPELPDMTFMEFADYKRTDTPLCPLCDAQMRSTGWGWRCRKHGEFKHSELGDIEPCEKFSGSWI